VTAGALSAATLGRQRVARPFAMASRSHSETTASNRTTMRPRRSRCSSSLMRSRARNDAGRTCRGGRRGHAHSG
jgi:hypothetical protein